VGAWSVAGVGAVAAAGFVVSGVVAPDDGAAPQAVPAVSTTAAASGGSDTPSVTPPDPGGETVAYVKEARTAVTQLDLKHMIVSVTTKEGTQHPDEDSLGADVDRQVYAGDGSASHWTSLKDVAGAVGSTVEDQEVKRVVPDAKDGLTTYWYISPRVGAYARFQMATGANGASLSDAIVEQLEELTTTLRAVQAMVGVDGVRSSAPATSTVDGRPAVCIRMSGDASTWAGWGAQSTAEAERAVEQERARLERLSAEDRKRLEVDSVLDWTSRTCIDPESRLPVLSMYSYHHQLAAFDSPSRRVHSETYEWLPKNATTEKLLEPDLKGLRRVTQHELGLLETP